MKDINESPSFCNCFWGEGLGTVVAFDLCQARSVVSLVSNCRVDGLSHLKGKVAGGRAEAAAVPASCVASFACNWSMHWTCFQ